MPTLIDTDKLIEDNWVKLEDSQSPEGQTGIIVSFDRLRQDYLRFIGANVDMGVVLDPDQNVEDLIFYLTDLKLILLQFEVFADGRAFSQARLLRDRYDFSGDIRAIGDVIPDQFGFMRRCGFSQFEIDEGVDSLLALEIMTRLPFCYQNNCSKI